MEKNYIVDGNFRKILIRIIDNANKEPSSQIVKEVNKVNIVDISMSITFIPNFSMSGILSSEVINIANVSDIITPLVSGNFKACKKASFVGISTNKNISFLSVLLEVVAVAVFVALLPVLLLC